ncbi:MAG TPA: histidine phosphatase family protein [Anaerolineae bacterium]|nr:histidine phosphatase family protein [Anaerolineae bacterium]
MRIYFTRHGESQANLLHEISNRGLRHGLTRRGREQAEALAQRLQGVPMARIYSSPVLRAIETSVILAHRLGVEYEVTDALREYDCGVLEGRSDEEAWQGWHELFDAWVVHGRWEQRLEGGESFYDIRSRFEPFIVGLVQRYGNTEINVACVAHGGVYWMMLPVVLKNVDTDLIAQLGFEYAACVVTESLPTGLYCVEWNGHTVDKGR